MIIIIEKKKMKEGMTNLEKTFRQTTQTITTSHFEKTIQRNRATAPGQYDLARWTKSIALGAIDGCLMALSAVPKEEAIDFGNIISKVNAVRKEILTTL
jgi:hypothetical protein